MVLTLDNPADQLLELPRVDGLHDQMQQSRVADSHLRELSVHGGQEPTQQAHVLLLTQLQTDRKYFSRVT